MSDMKIKPIISKSIDETHACAEDFLQGLSQGKSAIVVALSGDLGSGKTAFTKELASILGIPRDEVTSPTFVIEKIYQVNHPSFAHLIHMV